MSRQWFINALLYPLEELVFIAGDETLSNNIWENKKNGRAGSGTEGDEDTVNFLKLKISFS